MLCNGRVVIGVLAFSLCASQTVLADNTVTVLQFGALNVSSTVQSGNTSNSAETLQFGGVNQATATQFGSIVPSTINNSIIGQLGTSSTATVLENGGPNMSFVGQIGGANAATISQLGILNGSSVIQAGQ